MYTGMSKLENSPQSPVLLVDMSCRIGSRDASRDKALTLTDSSTPYPAHQQSGPRH